ncbi:hypothetical protein TNCV_1747601 [Trichonephila clavipes]|nr:hypothetical protein TNCV_1747601 [Trichonephila clavipes]
MTILTDKPRVLIEDFMVMTNQHRTWGRKQRLVRENRDNNSRQRVPGKKPAWMQSSHLSRSCYSHGATEHVALARW